MKPDMDVHTEASARAATEARRRTREGAAFISADFEDPKKLDFA
jgi:hypothetical protein|tara:strand:- start:2136 stop:2267 length:132 start_codon:yes stop_codon:yes gene_type:complete